MGNIQKSTDAASRMRGTSGNRRPLLTVLQTALLASAVWNPLGCASGPPVKGPTRASAADVSPVQNAPQEETKTTDRTEVPLLLKQLQEGDQPKKIDATLSLTRYYLRQGNWQGVEDLLKDSDPGVRNWTAWELGWSTGRGQHLLPLIPALSALLDDPLVGVHLNALTAIRAAASNGEDIGIAESQLKKDIEQGIGYIKSTAVSALAYWYIGKKAWEPVREFLKSDDPVVRKEALKALADAAQKGWDIKAVASDIPGSIQDDNGSKALVYQFINTRDWSAIERMLNSESMESRKNTAKWLGEAASDGKDIGPLEHALVSIMQTEGWGGLLESGGMEKGLFKEYALRALVHLYGNAHRWEDVKVLLEKEDFDTRLGTTRALGEMARNGKDIGSVLPSLRNYLQTDKSTVGSGREEAASTLTMQYVNTKNLEEAKKLLEDTDRAVRMGSVHGIGTELNVRLLLPLVPILQKIASEDTDLDIRRSAAQTLEYIKMRHP